MNKQWKGAGSGSDAAVRAAISAEHGDCVLPAGNTPPEREIKPTHRVKLQEAKRLGLKRIPGPSIYRSRGPGGDALLGDRGAGSRARGGESDSPGAAPGNGLGTGTARPQAAGGAAPASIPSSASSSSSSSSCSRNPTNRGGETGQVLGMEIMTWLGGENHPLVTPECVRNLKLGWELSASELEAGPCRGAACRAVRSCGIPAV
ncbi:PREDICTED: uncharacterized protein LOC101810617 [Ficedula albicollis]|uniref:uncharacterized protein LOC101810617 n=1 Tax=Ficedula albicollis TaxID=59894 RepID=UPI0007AD8281|nr:PREDICTED: uncharacterized protein LOC101810617 [Ficedula albicollis]